MHLIGMRVSIGGFLGIIAFGVLSVTRDLTTAIVTHAILFAVFLLLSLKRSGSLRNWVHMSIDAEYSLPYFVVAAVGLAFVTVGSYIAIFVEPGRDPDSMNKAQQIYFGVVFASIGGGIIPIAVSDWITDIRARLRQ